MDEGSWLVELPGSRRDGMHQLLASGRQQSPRFHKRRHLKRPLRKYQSNSPGCSTVDRGRRAVDASDFQSLQVAQRSTVEHPQLTGANWPLFAITLAHNKSFKQLFQKVTQAPFLSGWQAACLDLNRDVALGVLVPKPNDLSL